MAYSSYEKTVPENGTQKYPKLASLQNFEVEIPGNFQKWKFSFFSIFSEFLFATYASVSQISSQMGNNNTKAS